jgi:transcriptional regulator with XRE-family HTH domain
VEEKTNARTEIGARIARARLAAGFENGADFARACGVVPNTLYRWERGELVPDVFKIDVIARLTGVTLDWLIRGAETTTHAALRDWRATPRGATAPDPAVRFMESIPLEGYSPTPTFYDLVMIAWEAGLTPGEAFLGARFTESLRKR